MKLWLYQLDFCGRPLVVRAASAEAAAEIVTSRLRLNEFVRQELAANFVELPADGEPEIVVR